jgi:hypothetical protein
MIVGVLRLLALLVAGWATMSAAAAQSDPRVCAGLIAQLQRLDRAGSSPDAQRYQAALAQQRRQLDRALEMSDRMHCGGGGFIFGPSPAPQCPELMDRIAAMQQNEQALAARVSQYQGGDPRVEGQRQNVLAALAQNGCGGGQYAAAAPPRPRGLFDLLFGNREEEESPPPPNGPINRPEESVPRASTYRTVCVRKADGFFYPISFATTRNNFQRDAAICQRTCPGTPAEMFAYPNPGGSMKDAVAIDGQHYTDLPNAFLYKKKFVPGVSCKPAGETWVQALQGGGQNGTAATANNPGNGNGIVADDAASASRPTYDASGPPGSIGHVPAGPTGSAVAAGPPSGHSGVVIDGREPPATITTEPLDPLH